jgi:hypothetical protein
MYRLFKPIFSLMLIVSLPAAGLMLAAQADDKPPTESTQAEKPAPPAAPIDLNTATPQTAPTKPIFFPELTKFEKEFQAQLKEHTVAEFYETPLQDVIEYFKDSSGADYVIDRVALGDEGLTIDEPITVNVTHVSLKTALELILEPSGLTYVVDRDVVKITTKSKADDMLKTRVYPVGDLCQTPMDYLMLESVLKSANLGEWRELMSNVAPSQTASGGGFGGGSDNKANPGPAGGGFFQVNDQTCLNAMLGASIYQPGDEGTISIMPQSKALVICQTYHTHNAIVELLTQLRQAKDLKH